MTDAHNTRVAAIELQRFAAAVAHQIDAAGLAPDATELLVAVDDGSDVLMCVTEDGAAPSALAQIDQLLATPRRVMATVSVTAWSPTADGTSSVAWILIAVGRGGLPAFAAVRRIEEDTRWARLPPTQLPWFALSTASSMRAALEHGAPLKFKRATSEALHRRPDECPDPPLDERGEL